MDRFKSTKKATILGMVGNTFLFFIKITIGIICKSQAMIADSINSASDIFASLMGYIGNKISSKPKDNIHNFGHGKAEYIFSLFISLSMLFASYKLLHNAFLSLTQHNVVVINNYLFIICFITIITKISLFLYVNKINNKFNNILLKASKQDHFIDCIITTFTLNSIIFASFGIYWVDGVTSIGISLWIAYVGIKLLIESFNILMDSSINETTKNKIIELINTIPEIKGIESFYSSSVGYQYIIIFTINIDGNMSTFKSHEITNILERKIKKLENIYDVIIHINPIKIGG